MMKSHSKNFYKSITLSIKAVVFLLSIIYIWRKLSSASNTININEIADHSNKSYLYFTILLMLLNWSVEAVKWQLLIKKYERISFLKSLESIFSGVTVSIFTPNRVGEFAGRIFFLEKADKIQASIASVIGGMFQLAVTVIAGILAYYILEEHYEDFFRMKSFISENGLLLLIASGLLFISLLFFIYLKRNEKFKKYKKYIEVFTTYSKSTIGIVFMLSVLRYIIFSTQYYLLLKFFGINAGDTILYSLIAITFFVTSAIPTFALSEIVVRGATAVYFFSLIFTDSTVIIEASLLLWVINLAIPALLGGIFIWKLKFFKEE